VFLVRAAGLDGFTLSDFDPSKFFAAALVDQARKHRKRPPPARRRQRGARGKSG
jgi:hypothetical protein